MVVTAQEWEESERSIIQDFFENKVPKALGSTTSAEYECTEASCIQFAKTITQSEDVVSVENQGYNSYTLLCPSKSQIIQFRLKPFDTTMIDLAHKIYGDQVPRSILHNDFPLPTYSSSILPGRVHILQPFPEDKFPLQREKTTVIELGHFIARSTFFPQPKSSYTSSSWTTTANEKLQRLQKNLSLRVLAPEVAEAVVHLQSELYRLNDLPAVLTHHDFAQVNIFVSDAGNVTGVLDFDEAGIEAFGMCIWGLYECFFGSMEGGKWYFYDQDADGYPGRTVRQVLEAAFWDSLWSNVSPEVKREDCEAAVNVALRIGIINRYIDCGMIEEIDEAQKVHRLSLEYVKGILPAV